MGQLILFFLIGLFLAWIFRSYRRYETSNPYTKEQFRHISITREQLQQSELGLFVALVAKVAKADGRVSELEAELVGHMFTDISSMFPDPEQARSLLKEIFAIEKDQTFNIDDIALALRQAIGSDNHKRHMMMAFLINLAYADGHLSHSEERLLLKIASFLQFQQGEIEAMLRQASGMHTQATSERSIDEAYELLGATPDEPMESIKKKYRTLVRQYHPDIIKAQGKGDDYIEQATEKVQQINAAYELIKKSSH